MCAGKNFKIKLQDLKNNLFFFLIIMLELCKLVDIYFLYVDQWICILIFCLGIKNYIENKKGPKRADYKDELKLASSAMRRNKMCEGNLTRLQQSMRKPQVFLSASTLAARSALIVTYSRFLFLFLGRKAAVCTSRGFQLQMVVYGLFLCSWSLARVYGSYHSLFLAIVVS